GSRGWRRRPVMERSARGCRGASWSVARRIRLSAPTSMPKVPARALGGRWLGGGAGARGWGAGRRRGTTGRRRGCGRIAGRPSRGGRVAGGLRRWVRLVGSGVRRLGRLVCGLWAVRRLVLRRGGGGVGGGLGGVRRGGGLGRGGVVGAEDGGILRVRCRGAGGRSRLVFAAAGQRHDHDRGEGDDRRARPEDQPERALGALHLDGL